MTVAGFVLAVIALYVLCTAVVLGILAAAGSPYPSEAAEVPKSGIEEEPAEGDVAFERARPLTEAGPFVVAGSDLDMSEARVNLLFALLTLPYAHDAAVYERGVVGLYVAPEVDR